MTYKDFVRETGNTNYSDYHMKKFYPAVYEQREAERRRAERESEYLRERERESRITEYAERCKKSRGQYSKKIEAWGCEVSNVKISSLYESYYEYMESENWD